MQHPLITPPTPAEQLAALAAGALDAAARQQTGNIGSVTIPTAGGTKLIAGQGAGEQGFAPWVGDTTAPGIPTGIGVDSSAGMILVSWDGSLDGGVPADFDHVQILVDGVEAGQLRVRGTAALGPYEADSVHQVSARAWDDAHAQDGSPAPNGSAESAPVSVTVKSVVDPGQVQAAQDKAQDALDKIAGVSKDAQQASKDAQAASVSSAQAKQAADAASGLAGAASSKADSAAAAAAAASGKADTVLSRGVELARNPAFDPAWGDLDGFGLDMGTAGAPAKPPLPYSTYGALTSRDFFSSWSFPLDKGRRYRFGAWVIADSDTRPMLSIGWRYENPNTHWDGAIKVEAKDALTWTWVENTVRVPDHWVSKQNSICVWLNIDARGADATGWWITGLTVRDVTDSQDAKDQAAKAQATADGKNRIIASAAEPAHGGLALGDLWMQLDPSGHVSGIQVWNGKAFTDYVLLAQQVLVAGSVGTISLADGAVTAGKVTASEALLEKLLVRRIKADEIDVGTLAAAIVKSGSFSTSDGLAGFDSSGFWVKGKDGAKAFEAGAGGVRMTGSLETASGGDRLRVSRQYLPALKRTVGMVEGLHDSDSKWALTGFYDAQKTEVQLAANGRTPNVWVSSPSAADRDTLGLTGHDVEIGSQISGSMVSVSADDVHLGGSHGLHLDAGSIWARGVRLPVSLHAWGGYADHAGAWEISLRSAQTRYGSQTAVIAPALQAAGLRIPVSGYWLVYGSINIGGSGTPTVSLGVYDQASKSITSYGEGYIADFSTSTNTWLSQAMPPTLQWLNAGDVIMWRTSAGVNIGGGANSLCADLMPY